MIREVNLISYLPQFVEDYREIKQITNAENPEIQKLEDETEIIKRNQFILTCDDIGIGRFEKLLKIIPNHDDNLEARISRVITRWNDSIPYTFRGLIEKLNIMCGKGNYLLLPNFNEYELELIVSLPLSSQVGELDYLLSYMIPANIVVTANNVMNHTMEGCAYIGGNTVQVSHFDILTNSKTEDVLTGYINNASSVVTLVERTIN